ncbi:MAG: alpha-L-arabinofuranosidase, partial [Flavihumibacter sp.]
MTGRNLLAGALLTCSTLVMAQEHSLVVDASRTNGAVQPTMWGIFFEDINLGADGGIYAELVKNRSFEFIKPLMGWELNGKKLKEGSFLVVNEAKERPNNPRFLQVSLDNCAKGDLGLVNEGFRGMGIKKDLAFDFSVQYRRATAPVTLTLELRNSQGTVIGN